MSGRNGEDEPDPPADSAEATADEPRGLQGVDVQPLPPLTREEVEAMRRERDELRDQLLRRRADFENYKKRVERDRQQAGADATAAVLKALIPTLDNLDRALDAGDDSGVREGVALIRRDVLALLESQGVTVEDPKGQRFDPERHQALSHEHVPGYAEGTVVEVYGKGYSLRDRLLRPALVKVAKEADESGRGGSAVH